MKVVSKFAVAFFAASVLCLLAFTYVLANREASRLERAMATGLASFGEGLRPVVESAWREKGWSAAEGVGRAFDQGEVRVNLEPDVGVPPDDARAPPSTQEIVRDGKRFVVVKLGVTGPAGARASMRLERRMVEGSTIIRDELVDQLVAVFVLAVVMGVIAAGLGGLVIGGPLGRIVAQARRVGEGDLSQRLRSSGTDEIGVLKRELNAMCDRLADAKARLEEETAGRIETLEKLRHLDRLRTVGTIASGIAHELGTPLNVVLLRGQSLASGEIPPTEVAEAGEAIANQVEKMSRIVRQLLDFARERTAERDRVSELRLALVARHATALLSSLAKKHDVAISVVEEEDVSIRGDFGQVEQALTNLIVNGVQAMPGGGRLQVRVGRDPVTKQAAIDVIDEGEGMAPDVRERVFEPFFTTKPRAEGSGLGLHVARGIAEDHGGTITVESEVGRGTTFRLLLPEVA